MKSLSLLAVLGVLSTSAAFAAAAPAGSTGLCKDGTYSAAKSKSGACSGHQGVKEWYATSGAAAPAAPSAPAAMPAPMATPAPAAPAARPQVAAAPGGGAGQVWVNTSTKTYHCSGDKWYGKTKAGAYMSESDAKAKGFHADHGKACGA